MKKIILQIFSGFLCAVLGAIIGFLVDISTGEGLKITSVFEFVLPMVVGASIGFIIGFVLYKAVGKIFGLLSYFDIEI